MEAGRDLSASSPILQCCDCARSEAFLKSFNITAVKCDWHIPICKQIQSTPSSSTAPASWGARVTAWGWEMLGLKCRCGALVSLLLQQLFSQCCLFHGHFDITERAVLWCSPAAQQSCAHWKPSFILMGNGCGRSGKGAWASWERSEVGACPHRGALRSCAAPSHLTGIASGSYKEQD